MVIRKLKSRVKRNEEMEATFADAAVDVLDLQAAQSWCSYNESIMN